MVIISSAELRSNLKRYLDTALMETVVIQRGKKETFVLQKQDNFTEISSEIPEDFYRAITGKELITELEYGLRDIIQRKQKCQNSVSL